MREAPTFEEVGGFGLSVGHSAMLWYGGRRSPSGTALCARDRSPQCHSDRGGGACSCLSLWAVVICCMMERRAVGRSSGMISLLEEVQRLKVRCVRAESERRGRCRLLISGQVPGAVRPAGM